MIRTLLIPGLDGAPPPHWQHWWAATDPTARIVEPKSRSAPTPDAWLAEIAAATLAHPGAVLVGHGLGAIAIAELLSASPRIDVAGALLVAPAAPSRRRHGAAFGPIPARPLPTTTIVAASRNDPWMAQAQARDLAERWGADFFDMGEAGHINAASGHGPWPEGKSLRDLLWSMLGAGPAQTVARPVGRAVFASSQP